MCLFIREIKVIPRQIQAFLQFPIPVRIGIQFRRDVSQAFDV